MCQRALVTGGVRARFWDPICWDPIRIQGATVVLAIVYCWYFVLLFKFRFRLAATQEQGTNKRVCHLLLLMKCVILPVA